MKTAKKYLFFFCFIFILSGCATATPARLLSLQTGMSKQEVLNALGNRHIMQRSSTYKNGVPVETWEYSSYQPLSPYANGLNGNVIYWIQFVDNKLVFCGFPGDYGSGVNQRIGLDVNKN
jgi:hypothetical protein